MSELTIDRRQAVRAAAGVAAGGMLVAGAGVGSAAASNRHDRRDDHYGNGSALLGSWLITHRDNAPAPPNTTKGVISIIPGGVLINNDIDPAGTPASGSWADRGHGRFVATFWGGFPAEGKNPAGVYKVQATGHLNRNGTVSGTYRATIYPKGQKSQSGTGTFAGSKIPAD
jgi:hypothetical protein